MIAWNIQEIITLMKYSYHGNSYSIQSTEIWTRVYIYQLMKEDAFLTLAALCPILLISLDPGVKIFEF